MKLAIGPSERNGFRVIRAFAVISKSIKSGIPRRFQKTWCVRTVAPEYGATEHADMFKAEALRWEKKVLERCKRDAEAIAAAEKEVL